MKYKHSQEHFGYECLDSWIKQEHVRLETGGVQNGNMSRNNHENNKEEME